MRPLRWLLWLVLLLAATGAVYWLLATERDGQAPPPPPSASDAGVKAPASDQLTEEDRRSLDDLIRQRLQSRDGGRR